MLLLFINELCDSINKIRIDLLLLSSGGGPAFGAVWPWQQGRPIRVAVAVAVGGLIPDDFDAAALAMVGMPECAAGIFDGIALVVTVLETAVESAFVDVVDAGEAVSAFWTDSSLNDCVTSGSLILNHCLFIEMQ